MVSLADFAERRHRVCQQLTPKSLCIIPAARRANRSNDTDYPFRQNSDFFYLTGFNEPDAVLVLSNIQDGETSCFLFCQPSDEHAEIWHGRRLGPERAPELLGLDEAYSLDEFDAALSELLCGHQQVYLPMGQDSEIDGLVSQQIAELRAKSRSSQDVPSQLRDIRPVIHEMRLFKSAAEVATMHRAAEISAEAHLRAMQTCCPGRFEYQLAAEIQYVFGVNGCRSAAYESIVGSGENACILHYTDNQATLRDGDLVLIDAGAELDGYAADITRTFPVNGRFSEAQKAIYQLVLDAQNAAFEFMRPGCTLQQATEASIRVITQGLIQLGILGGDIEQNIADKTYRRYFMHGLGHWLGLDVHDVGDYQRDGDSRPFEAGMVLTVEPGLYFGATSDTALASKWRGIGIRIEDNVLITENGYENLTQSVPKTIAEIEAVMNKQ